MPDTLTVGLPLCVHAEVTTPDVDVFDREGVFLRTILTPLVAAHPRLKVVVEHVTTAEGVAWVKAARPGVAATITPQHLLLNRNALFEGGLRPHRYCLPVLKCESDRVALLAAATSGDPRFFAGTDSAPHEAGAKEGCCGSAGMFTAVSALELYATAFDSVGKLDALPGCVAGAGASFYGLPRQAGSGRLRRIAISSRTVPRANSASQPP